eukprot:scaffold73124_cov33-Prasinocladus_malaysianus.AAC.1
MCICGREGHRGGMEGLSPQQEVVWGPSWVCPAMLEAIVSAMIVISKPEAHRRGATGNAVGPMSSMASPSRCTNPADTITGRGTWAAQDQLNAECLTGLSCT